jgi:hypothetical protein
MDRVTQDNAANAEQSASAAVELETQAEQMEGILRELIAIVGTKGAGGYGEMAHPIEVSDSQAGNKRATKTARKALSAFVGKLINLQRMKKIALITKMEDRRPDEKIERCSKLRNSDCGMRNGTT